MNQVIIGLPYVLLFDQKSLFSEDAKKWPKVLLFGIRHSENMSNHSSTKNFGKVQGKQQPADVMTFFFLYLLLGRKIDICGRDDLFFLVFTSVWAEIWTSEDIFFGLHLFLGKKMDICGHDDPQRTCPPFAQ